MEQVMPGLYASEPTTPDFAPGSHVRAFLVQHPAGNVLLYASERVSAGADAIRRLGGLSRVVLSHWHETLFGASGIGAPVHVAEADRAEAEARCPIAGTFEGRQMLEDGIETIPIPGHTPGSTAFLVTLDGKRCLFTGDSLYFGKAGWSVALLPSSDRNAYLDSLETLRATAFDVLVPSFAPAGAAFVEAVSEKQRLERIGAPIGRLRSGEDR